MLSSPCYLCLIYFFTIDMLLQSISYVHHLQDRSNQQVQPLTLQVSVYCTSGTNWVTKGLRLIAFCSFGVFGKTLCFMCFFSICKITCQKEELCDTAVGCSWLCKVCKVWKVMSTPQGFLLRKFIACSAQQVLEWTARTHQRFTGMVCWSHFATTAWPQKISVQKDR